MAITTEQSTAKGSKGDFDIEDVYDMLDDSKSDATATTTSSSNVGHLLTQGCKIPFTVVGTDSGKKVYHYAYCCVCAGTDNMMPNQKGCRGCKRDSDHMMNSCKKRDELENKKTQGPVTCTSSTG